ncbi:hypothetical protein EBZ35_04900 [bacterium]|nr:hypothetical protein [bacterium]
MKKVIVTTTINPPTEAVIKFDRLADWELIVIGDLKTPADYRLDRGTYVSPAEQEAYSPKLSDALGWNCIQRRNVGFLMALDRGADVVAVVDDDNIPMDGWGSSLMLGTPTMAHFYHTELPAFDPVSVTNYPHLWHRGYPLQLLSQRHHAVVSTQLVSADIQADFWNGDPDIDAICRMEHSPDAVFDPACFPIASNKPGPFNSQNTFIKASWLPNYFLFPGIGRMDDIWASYYVQALGASVIYGPASVYQQRNVHDLTRDMIQEFIGYEHNLSLLQALSEDPSRIRSYIPEQAWHAFECYQQHIKSPPTTTHQVSFQS